MLTLISQAALFTMMYSDSLARFVFEGDENFSGSYLSGAGESGYKITLSLAILALPSMFSGFFFKSVKTRLQPPKSGSLLPAIG